MKTILTRILAGLLMLVVAVITAFVTLRLFIHGREVNVPNLAGLSDADAAIAARKLGLNLSVENRFYSAAVAPNHVLSQSPMPGSEVRRGWQVRVTESLGGQRVDVPDVTGQTDRPASLILRRMNLELGPIAHLPVPSQTGIVLAQSPPANTAGLNGPRVGLLISEDMPASNSIAYVMPQLIGMSVANASARLATAGLHLASATDPSVVIAAPDSALADPDAPPPDPAIPPTVVSPPPVNPSAIIASQSPAPGHRVSRADSIRVTVAHPMRDPTAIPPTS